jgi:hypothetical protein
MKILFAIRSHYQLIIAIRLAKSYYKGNKLYLLLSDCTVGFDKLVDNPVLLSIFDSVYYYPDINILKEHKKHPFSYIANVLFDIKKLALNMPYDFSDIDMLVFNNLDIFNAYLLEIIRKDNAGLSWARFEHSQFDYLTSDREQRFPRLLNFRRRVGKDYFDTKGKAYYFYHPDEVAFDNKQSQYVIKTIPVSNDSNEEIDSLVMEIYDIFDATVSEYDKKYIFFEQCYYDEGLEIEDESLIIDIADIVGKENLLVKLHPRTKTDRYSDKGISVAANSAVPWEAIEQHSSISNKVLMTINSSAAVNINNIAHPSNIVVLLHRYESIHFPLSFHARLRKNNDYLDDVCRQNSNVFAPKNSNELKMILNRVY